MPSRCDLLRFARDAALVFGISCAGMGMVLLIIGGLMILVNCTVGFVVTGGSACGVGVTMVFVAAALFVTAVSMLFAIHPFLAYSFRTSCPAQAALAP